MTDPSVSAITPERFLREFRHQWHRDCQHGDKVTECLDGSCLALFAAEGGLRAALLSSDRAVPPEAAEIHRDCHDVVCNGDRNQPRGAHGVSCSCQSRYQRMLEELIALKRSAEASDRAVHPELIAKWRKASDLADKHPPFSYEQGVCVGIGYCADELETGRDDAIESIGNDELAASDRAVKEPMLYESCSRMIDYEEGLYCNLPAKHLGKCKPLSDAVKKAMSRYVWKRDQLAADSRRAAVEAAVTRGLDTALGPKYWVPSDKAAIVHAVVTELAAEGLIASPASQLDVLIGDFTEALEAGVGEKRRGICPHCEVDHTNEARLNRAVVALTLVRLKRLRGLAEVSSPARPQLQLVERIIDRLRMRISQWRDTQQRDKAAAEAVSKVLIRHALESSSELHEGFANFLECDLEDFEKWVAEGAASSAPPAAPPFKHLIDEITAAHQALDRAGVPLTKAVRKREGEGQHDITMGLADRIAAIRPSAPPVRKERDANVRDRDSCRGVSVDSRVDDSHAGGTSGMAAQSETQEVAAATPLAVDVCWWCRSNPHLPSCNPEMRSRIAAPPALEQNKSEKI